MSAKIYPFPGSASPDDLYDYARPQIVARRASIDACSSLGYPRVWSPEIVDDWPISIPVSEVEIDLFEGYFGDLLDEVFGSKR
ncbi:hypothetical protein [Pinisolibacter aquiterrae]|uniref:hypothetical protein n=1 Tax=Pinisolibacter aquiterrae TaxID=2815579 RepID=UPI001C3E4091|nr:hypothetical protein [Pinisolibacter aquiterrae]MBV5265011.1 hypothetical protein [Pinisolibacter aquiterrae]MCC8235607.1 hypothetical protein [Pinisolibacter aquiterrae]